MRVVLSSIKVFLRLISLLTSLTFVVGILWVCALGQTQESSQSALTAHPLITQALDETRLTTLDGNTHPLARPEFDLGTAPASLPMERMLLVLKRNTEQETALRKLLDDQQDKNSPNHHKWLTPEQFGKQFGPTDADLQTITSWLQSHGFQVGTTKGRSVLEFSGSASQVAEAFHTSIHKYVVNGAQHWANASDPQIPTALVPAVQGVLTLHNFLKKPASHFSPDRAPAKLIPGKKPQVTFSQNGQVVHALAPQDYSVIYNMNSLAVSGQSSIAVVGRSNLYNGGQDIGNFQNVFGTGGSFFVVLNGPDPGDLGGGEEAEATLDSSWSSALAPGATVSLVVSATTNSSDGIDLSEAYIIEQNLAAIMTESFSACELFATDAQMAGQSAMAEQAAAQGITYIVSTGDDGATGCDDPNTAPAIYGLAVNYLASTPFNVAVGGTMFNENGQDTKYWSTTTPVSESAISYIPEDVWNESSATNGLWSSSGGASAGNIASGGATPGVPKPSWQSGVPGIPADGVRDLPDLSLSAAAHDPYLLCLEGSCVPDSQGQFFVYFISGTSASAPSFAGIMARVNDQNFSNTGELRQGLANYILYRLAASQAGYPSQCNGSSTSALPPTTCIFNDVTVGNNVVPGETATSYQATAGYDLTTGLGSVNVGNLVSQWNTVNFNPTTTTLTVTPGTITHGAAVPFAVTVAPNSGTGIPTGNVSLMSNTAGATSSLGFWTLSGGTISANVDTLIGGSTDLDAFYAGDSTFAPSTSAASSPFTVTPEPSTTTLSVLTANQSGQAIPFTNGPFGSFVYLRADIAGQSGLGVATGSVTFADSFGAIPGGGTFTLNGQGNTATPNGIFNFDTGTHTISASYSGDNSFNASSSTVSQTFTITPGFYAAIPSAQSTVVITAPGSSGTSSIGVTNSTGFKGTIALACSGLPLEAQCSFSPASISANGAINTTASTITVTTTAATAMARSQRRTFLPAVLMMGFGLFFSTLIIGGNKQRIRVTLMMLIALLLFIVPSCGGGGGGSSRQGPPPNLGTPKGVSTITVTATSGSIVSTTGFTLNVQ